MPAQVITYEVYIVDGGRWVLHARFRREEREKALEDAHTIERELNTQVKVIREVYNASANTSEETTVYASEKPRRATSNTVGMGRSGYGGGGGGGGFGGGGGGGGGARGGAIAAKRGAQLQQLQGTMGAMTRLVLILAGSLCGAGIFTMIASMIISRLPYWGVPLYVENLAPIQFMVFIFGFLLIAIPLATKKVRWAGFSENRPSPRDKAPAKPAKNKSKAKPKPKPKTEDEAAPEVPLAEEPEAEAEADSKEEKKEEPAEEPKEEPAEEPSGESAGVAVEMQRDTMGKFTSGLLAEVQKARPQLDAYNRFGVSLMLAGAVDVVGESASLEPEQRRTLLADTLTGIGTKPDAAKSFSAKYEEYMVEKRYLGMVQAGRVAAEGFLENPDAPFPPMKGLLDAWGKPQQQQAAPRIVAVMFTDMVGSTDMTQAKGDQAAQIIVRRHNSIVRAALNEYGGKQIKHTGDGIMASFPSPGSGVEAAVAIQRAVAANNARFPDQSLHLRIGINAGEPIEEEEDLFGATVQLAARVCAACGTDQIVCTNVVRELTSSKTVGFTARGAQSLKGFSEKIALFEVSWT